jgi:hypothetical protein
VSTPAVFLIPSVVLNKVKVLTPPQCTIVTHTRAVAPAPALPNTTVTINVNTSAQARGLELDELCV